MHPHDLDHYRTAGPLTHSSIDLGDLPADPTALGAIIQGLLVHRDWAPLYDLAADQIRLEEQQLRTTVELLARIVELDDRPLTAERQPARRVLCICRHYALLHTALLRAHGTAARVRCGFAGYFEAGTWVDHWITEWWNGERWIRHDTQIDELQRSIITPDFNLADQPPGRFLTGAEAWLAARAGTVDPERFGIADMWGLGFIAGNVVLDMACLNKVELLPWDAWGLELGPFDEIDEPTAAWLDEVAELVMTDDTDAIRRRYASDDHLRVPTDITSYVDGQPTPVRLEL